MTVDDIFKILVNHTREVLPEVEDHDFRMEDSLRELGANSIDRSEILMLTLESLSLSIPLIVVAKAENMGELAGLLHGSM
ncbi:MAG: acyl carrier protein [Pseudomonadota bacterium]|nr:acyl carrier protein [Pseudomonadota bacterium]